MYAGRERDGGVCGADESKDLLERRRRSRTVLLADQNKQLFTGEMTEQTLELVDVATPRDEAIGPFPSESLP